MVKLAMIFKSRAEYLLLILLLISSFFSCNKDPYEAGTPVDYGNGILECSVNGKTNLYSLHVSGSLSNMLILEYHRSQNSTAVALYFDTAWPTNGSLSGSDIPLAGVLFARNVTTTDVNGDFYYGLPSAGGSSLITITNSTAILLEGAFSAVCQSTSTNDTNVYTLNGNFYFDH